MVEIQEVAKASRVYSISAWVGNAAIVTDGVFNVEEFADESHLTASSIVLPGRRVGPCTTYGPRP
jgi:hypothetical protein